MPLATKELSLKPALQQPAWEDEDHIAEVREELSGFPALVGADEGRTLRALLVTVAQGKANIIQAGDCAEDLAESTAAHVARKVGMLSMLAGAMRMADHKPVLRIGRIAGQYSKPRSNPTETVDGVELPVFRGQMVNGHAPNASDRKPDPTRLLSGYWAANRVLHHLGWRRPSSIAIIEPPVWTSHEALLLDYELPALRRDAEGTMVLTSTHWPWCNVIAPGSTESPMLRAMLGASNDTVVQGNLADPKIGIPLRKVAQPADIANAAAFLLSDAASHITMHTLVVDGGATLGV